MDDKRTGKVVTTMTDAPFSFEARAGLLVNHAEAYVVVDEYRGYSDPVAVCFKPEDALRIVDALNNIELGRVPSMLSDSDLVTAYQRSTAEPSDVETEAFVVEIKRRGLSI